MSEDDWGTPLPRKKKSKKLDGDDSDLAKSAYDVADPEERVEDEYDNGGY